MDLDELTGRSEQSHDEPNSTLLRARVAAPAPVAPNDELFVEIDSLDNGEYKHGPCRWSPLGLTLPGVGQECVVATDNTGVVCVLEWETNGYRPLTTDVPGLVNPLVVPTDEVTPASAALNQRIDFLGLAPAKGGLLRLDAILYRVDTAVGASLLRPFRNRVTIEGANRLATILQLAPGGSAVFGLTNTIGLVVRHVTFDGNTSAWGMDGEVPVDGVPPEPSHGISASGGYTPGGTGIGTLDGILEDIGIWRTAGYGMGLQDNGPYINNTWRLFHVRDTGSDGFDIKNDAGLNRDNRLIDWLVERPNRSKESGNTGIDLRGIRWNNRGLTVLDLPAGTKGIRARSEGGNGTGPDESNLAEFLVDANPPNPIVVAAATDVFTTPHVHSYDDDDEVIVQGNGITALASDPNPLFADRFTSKDHGYVNGDEVVLSNLVGGAGLTAGIYYVRDKDVDHFKVAATVGGAAVDITTDLTAGLVMHSVGLSAGTPYYVRDATPTTFKLAATVGGAAVNITADLDDEWLIRQSRPVGTVGLELECAERFNGVSGDVAGLENGVKVNKAGGNGCRLHTVATTHAFNCGTGHEVGDDCDDITIAGSADWCATGADIYGNRAKVDYRATNCGIGARVRNGAVGTKIRFQGDGNTTDIQIDAGAVGTDLTGCDLTGLTVVNLGTDTRWPHQTFTAAQLATVSAVGRAGQDIYVSDAAAGNKRQYSDGANWIVLG